MNHVKFIFLLLAFFPLSLLKGQHAEAVNEDSLNELKEVLLDSINQEAESLYRLERAAWVGTDLLLPKLRASQTEISGYVSYLLSEKSFFIFYQNRDEIKIVGTATFNKTVSEDNAEVSVDIRKPTAEELALIKLRRRAVAEIDSSLVKRYNKIDLNISFIRKKWGWHSYILSASQRSDIVVIGNDASLKFRTGPTDTSFMLISKKKLHNSLLTYKSNIDTSIFSVVHAHVLDDGLFTVPELVTLRLYKNYYNWKQFVVVGKTFYSMYDKGKDYYLLMTRIALDRIRRHQKDRIGDK